MVMGPGVHEIVDCSNDLLEYYHIHHILKLKTQFL